MSAAAGVSVRAVAPADVPRVWELVGELAAFEKLEDLRTGSAAGLAALLFGAAPPLFGRVAERDGRIVGYALFHFTWSSFRTAPRLWLEDLYVEESARGTGAGEALFRAFAAEAVARGCARAHWEVLDWNPARTFYERLGAAPASDGFLIYGLDAAGLRALVPDPPAR